MEYHPPYSHYGNMTANLPSDVLAGSYQNLTLESLLSGLSMASEEYDTLMKELESGDLPFSNGGSSVARVLVKVIDHYVVPTVAVVGLVGNILSFIVFVCSYLRSQSSSVYLAALSVADFAFLFTVLISKIGVTGNSHAMDLYQQNGWCQFFTYITYVSSFLSMWYVVAFTVERYIATNFPLRRRACTCKRAKIVVVTLFVVAMALYSFGLFTSGITVMFGYPVCGPIPKFYRFASIMNYIDTVITLIIPFISILVMNIRIGYKVVRFYRRRSHAGGDDNSVTLLEPGVQANRHLSLRISVSRGAQSCFSQRQYRVTKMLLMVSTTFLLLNLPRHTTRTYSFIMSLTDVNFVPSEDYVLIQKLFQVLYYLHFSVNIFLYSAMADTFRKAGCSVCRLCRQTISEHVGKLGVNIKLSCCPPSGNDYDSTTQETSLRFLSRHDIITQL